MKPILTKILLLEDNPVDAQLVGNELDKSNLTYNMKVVTNKIDFTAGLIEFKPDIIISEYSLPSFDSKEALAIVKMHLKRTPFIILTNTKSENFAAEVIKEGGYDYLLKDHLMHLRIVLTNALQKAKIEKEQHHSRSSKKLLIQTETFAHVGGWQFDFIKGKANWSDETYRMLGYEPGEIEPGLQTFLKCVHPDDIERVRKTIYDAEHTSPFSRKFVARIINSKTKEVRHLQTVVMFEFNEAGEKLRALGFHHDITVEKEIEARLIRKRIHLLTSQRLANIGSWEIDFSDNTNPEANPTYWSDELYRIFGLDSTKKPPEWSVFMEFVHPEDKELLLSKFTEAIESRKTFNLDYRLVLPNNVTKIVHSRGELIINKQTDKLLKVIGTTQDITQRKEEEEAFKKSEANLRTIFDNTTTCFLLINSELKIVSLNKAATEGFKSWIGKPIFTGDNILDFIMEDRKQRAVGMYKRVFEGEQFKFEDSFKTHDGATIWYFMQLLPVYGENNKVLNMIFYIRDITDRKLAEIEREKITTHLIQRNKDLEQFSYIVSHNLRLPVANIMGLIEGFGINQLPTEEQRDIASAIYVSVRALDDIVLDLNKILDTRNKRSEDKTNLKLSEIVLDTKVNLGFAIKKENAIIETDFTGCDELFAMKSYITSIFHNLILNSIRFRQPSLTPFILIKCLKKDNKTVLSFTDNGLGIDMNTKGKDLFGLYKRFHPHIPGKGTGLFMVKTQVEVMGGKISATSEVNKGSTFTIEFA